MFALNPGQAEASTEGIPGIIKIYGIYARVLVDTGADVSFIASEFVRVNQLHTKPLVEKLLVVSPMGSSLSVERACFACPLEIKGMTILSDLVVMPMKDLDIILGWDWISEWVTGMNPQERTITIKGMDQEVVF